MGEMDFLLGFALGIILGIILWIIIRNKKLKISWNEKNFLAVIVSFVWVSSFLGAVFIESYDTPVMIHTLMWMVVWYFYDTKFLINK